MERECMGEARGKGRKGRVFAIAKILTAELSDRGAGETDPFALASGALSASGGTVVWPKLLLPQAMTPPFLSASECSPT